MLKVHGIHRNRETRKQNRSDAAQTEFGFDGQLFRPIRFKNLLCCLEFLFLFNIVRISIFVLYILFRTIKAAVLCCYVRED